MFESISSLLVFAAVLLATASSQLSTIVSQPDWLGFLIAQDEGGDGGNDGGGDDGGTTGTANPPPPLTSNDEATGIDCPPGAACNDGGMTAGQTGDNDGTDGDTGEHCIGPGGGWIDCPSSADNSDDESTPMSAASAQTSTVFSEDESTPMSAASTASAASSTDTSENSSDGSSAAASSVASSEASSAASCAMDENGGMDPSCYDPCFMIMGDAFDPLNPLRAVNICSSSSMSSIDMDMELCLLNDGTPYKCSDACIYDPSMPECATQCILNPSSPECISRCNADPSLPGCEQSCSGCGLFCTEEECSNLGPSCSFDPLLGIPFLGTCAEPGAGGPSSASASSAASRECDPTDHLCTGCFSDVEDGGVGGYVPCGTISPGICTICEMDGNCSQNECGNLGCDFYPGVYQNMQFIEGGICVPPSNIPPESSASSSVKSSPIEGCNPEENLCEDCTDVYGSPVPCGSLFPSICGLCTEEGSCSQAECANLGCDYELNGQTPHCTPPGVTATCDPTVTRCEECFFEGQPVDCGSVSPGTCGLCGRDNEYDGIPHCNPNNCYDLGCEPMQVFLPQFPPVGPMTFVPAWACEPPDPVLVFPSSASESSDSSESASSAPPDLGETCDSCGFFGLFCTQDACESRGCDYQGIFNCVPITQNPIDGSSSDSSADFSEESSDASLPVEYFCDGTFSNTPCSSSESSDSSADSSEEFSEQSSDSSMPEEFFCDGTFSNTPCSSSESSDSSADSSDESSEESSETSVSSEESSSLSSEEISASSDESSDGSSQESSGESSDASSESSIDGSSASSDSGLNQCEQCGEGILNNCDQEECEELGCTYEGGFVCRDAGGNTSSGASDSSVSSSSSSFDPCDLCGAGLINNCDEAECASLGCEYIGNFACVNYQGVSSSSAASAQSSTDASASDSSATSEGGSSITSEASSSVNACDQCSNCGVGLLEFCDPLECNQSGSCVYEGGFSCVPNPIVCSDQPASSSQASSVQLAASSREETNSGGSGGGGNSVGNNGGNATSLPSQPRSSSSRSQAAPSSANTAALDGYCCMQGACVQSGDCSQTIVQCLNSCALTVMSIQENFDDQAFMPVDENQQTFVSEGPTLEERFSLRVEPPFSPEVAQTVAAATYGISEDEQPVVLVGGGSCTFTECADGGQKYCSDRGLGNCQQLGLFPCIQCEGLATSSAGPYVSLYEGESEDEIQSSAAQTSAADVSSISLFEAAASSEPECSQDSECSTYRCEGGRCLPCSSNDQCESNLCLNGRCTVCQAGLKCAPGESCIGTMCISKGAPGYPVEDAIELPITIAAQTSSAVSSPAVIAHLSANEAPVTPQPPAHPSSGPAAIAVMAAGAASGYAYMKKKRRNAGYPRG